MKKNFQVWNRIQQKNMHHRLYSLLGAWISFTANWQCRRPNLAKTIVSDIIGVCLVLVPRTSYIQFLIVSKLGNCYRKQETIILYNLDSRLHTLASRALGSRLLSCQKPPPPNTNASSSQAFSSSFL